MDFDIDKDKLIVDVDGKKVEYKILFTFDSEDTMKSYIGYTDETTTPDERKNIFVSSYDPSSNDGILEDVKDQKELDMVSDVLKQIYNSIEKA